MAFNPLHAAGILIRAHHGAFTPIGSCCAFRQDRIVLTAAHCVANVERSELQVYFRWRGDVRQAVKVDVHPKADLAVVELSPSDDDVTVGYSDRAFWNYVANYGVGEDFFAYGFPVEGPNPEPDPTLATPRLFRGHYQRFLTYESPLGYSYAAGELSIPAPGGLSGGPVFRGGVPMLTSVVAENVDSYTILDSVEEVSGAQSLRIEHHRIISYGIAVMLDQVRDWLDELAPHQQGTPGANP